MSLSLWDDVRCHQVCERAAEKVKTGEKWTCDQHPQEPSSCLGLARDFIHAGFLIVVGRRSKRKQMLDDPTKLGQGTDHGNPSSIWLWMRCRRFVQNCRILTHQESEHRSRSQEMNSRSADLSDCQPLINSPAIPIRVGT